MTAWTWQLASECGGTDPWDWTLTLWNLMLSPLQTDSIKVELNCRDVSHTIACVKELLTPLLDQVQPKINKYINKAVCTCPPPRIFFKRKSKCLLDYLKNAFQYTLGADNTVWFHIYEISRLVKFIESESTLVDIRGRVRGKGMGG